MSTPDAASQLTVTTEVHGDHAVVHCKGRLVSGNADLLYKPASALIPGHKHITLDLDGLTYMDSMGIGTVIRLYVACKTHHVAFDVRNLSERIRELLIMVNLLPVLSTVGEQGIRI
jgi:anti-anti-sigma factor